MGLLGFLLFWYPWSWASRSVTWRPHMCSKRNLRCRCSSGELNRIMFSLETMLCEVAKWVEDAKSEIQVFDIHWRGCTHILITWAELRIPIKLLKRRHLALLVGRIRGQMICCHSGYIPVRYILCNIRSIISDQTNHPGFLFWHPLQEITHTSAKQILENILEGILYSLYQHMR